MARTDDVVDAIKDMILAGELQPGDRLPVEKDLAERLGLSRGPLREGVRVLTAMGVLDTRQGDGTYVTSLEPHLLLAPLSFVVDLHTPKGAQQLLAVRRVLECEAAANAAIHADGAVLRQASDALDEAQTLLGVEPTDYEALLDADQLFHRVVSTAAGNAVLAAIIESISSRTANARLLRELQEPGSVRRTVDEHRGILNAIVSKNPDRARLLMGVHLLGVEDFVSSGPAPATSEPNKAGG